MKATWTARAELAESVALVAPAGSVARAELAESVAQVAQAAQVARSAGCCVVSLPSESMAPLVVMVLDAAKTMMRVMA